jgi:prophage maintenance system killer protein
MEDLTVEQVEAVHRRLMEEAEGDIRIVSEANLFQMVFRANMTEDVVLRASLVFWSLCAFPAFREGNEKTALTLAEQVLADNGYCIRGDRSALLVLAQRIREFSAESEEIDQWLIDNTRTAIER